jgi:hypothetical protein
MITAAAIVQRSKNLNNIIMKEAEKKNHVEHALYIIFFFFNNKIS